MSTQAANKVNDSPFDFSVERLHLMLGLLLEQSELGLRLVLLLFQRSQSLSKHQPVRLVPQFRQTKLGEETWVTGTTSSNNNSHRSTHIQFTIITIQIFTLSAASSCERVFFSASTAAPSLSQRLRATAADCLSNTDRNTCSVNEQKQGETIGNKQHTHSQSPEEQAIEIDYCETDLVFGRTASLLLILLFNHKEEVILNFEARSIKP